jgi:hypothetical protein
MTSRSVHPMMMQAIVHEHPCPSLRFQRAVPIGRHRDVLRLIDDMFTAINGLARPFAVEVTQVALDVELGLPHPDVVIEDATVAIVYRTAGAEVVVDLSGGAVVRAEAVRCPLVSRREIRWTNMWSLPLAGGWWRVRPGCRVSEVNRCHS